MPIIRDGAGFPYTSLDSYNSVMCTPPAFTGGTADSHGDSAGTGNPLTLFTVTGDVFVRVFGVCTVSLASAGGGTLEVGVAGNTAGILAQETATDIDANGIYISATQVVGVVAASSVPGPFLVANGLDIIETVGTADITAGAIYYVCLWRPASQGSSVVSAI